MAAIEGNKGIMVCLSTSQIIQPLPHESLCGPLPFCSLYSSLHLARLSLIDLGAMSIVPVTCWVPNEMPFPTSLLARTYLCTNWLTDVEVVVDPVSNLVPIVWSFGNFIRVLLWVRTHSFGLLTSKTFNGPTVSVVYQTISNAIWQIGRYRVYRQIIGSR